MQLPANPGNGPRLIWYDNQVIFVSEATVCRLCLARDCPWSWDTILMPQTCSYRDQSRNILSVWGLHLPSAQRASMSWPMPPAWGCCYTTSMLEYSLGFSCSWNHSTHWYHSGKSLGAQHEVSGTTCAQVIPSMYNVCGMMEMVKWSHPLELYPELQGKALQTIWHFILAADLPASTEVHRVIYYKSVACME